MRIDKSFFENNTRALIFKDNGTTPYVFHRRIEKLQESFEAAQNPKLSKIQATFFPDHNKYDNVVKLLSDTRLVYGRWKALQSLEHARLARHHPILLEIFYEYLEKFSSAFTPDLIDLRHIEQGIHARNPSSYLELGVGFSTIYAAYIINFYKMTVKWEVVDDDPLWLERIKEFLSVISVRYNWMTIPRFQIVDEEPCKIWEFESSMWSLPDFPESYDLIYLDAGPRLSIFRGFESVRDRIGKGTLVMVDARYAALLGLIRHASQLNGGYIIHTWVNTIYQSEIINYASHDHFNSWVYYY